MSDTLIGFDSEPRESQALMVPDDGSGPYVATGVGRHTLNFQVPPTHAGTGAWLHVTNNGYPPYSKRMLIPPFTPPTIFDPDLLLPELDESGTYYTLPPVILQRLGLLDIHTEGTSFVDSLGRLWYWKGVTDFSLYMKFRAGQDITPIVRDRTSRGANVFRVFIRNAWILANEPYDYASAVAFRDFIATEQAYVEFVVLGDCEAVGQDRFAQHRHVDDFTQALSGKPTFAELVNEAPHGGTHVDVFDFAFPGGDKLVWSRGSNLGDETPPLPPWHYATHHPSRSRDWMVHGTDNIYFNLLGSNKGHGVPFVLDEPIGADEGSVPGRRADQPEHFRIHSKIAKAAGCAGVTFHSTAGLTSDLYPPVQAACADACFQGLE